MPRGGFRPGAGRKKNSPNKATRERQARVAETGITPLDYLLDVMRDEGADFAMRLEAAREAAPYIHPKLASVAIKDVPPPRSIEEIDARLVELITELMQRRDRDRRARVESKAPALIRGRAFISSGTD